MDQINDIEGDVSGLFGGPSGRQDRPRMAAAMAAAGEGKPAGCACQAGQHASGMLGSMPGVAKLALGGAVAYGAYRLLR